MGEEVMLIDAWASPFGMRVRIALAEKGVKYEYKDEDLTNKSPLLLKLNPIHKKIPILVHNGKPISESLIAVEYIDEVWSHQSRLLPSDSYLKAQAKFWASYVDQRIYDLGKGIWATKGEAQEEGKKAFIETFKLLEGELGEQPFFGGENLGIVDVALVPFYSWFYAYETCGNFSIEAHCPKIIAWAKRCMQKESVAKSLPDQHKIYEFCLELKKRYGVE